VPLAADKEWRGQEKRSTTCRDKCREVTVYDSGTTRHFQVRDLPAYEGGVKESSAFGAGGSRGAPRVRGQWRVPIPSQPSMGPPAAGPLLATPAHGVGHAQWASNGRRSHGSRAGPFGKGSVVARPAYRLGAKLPWNKEPDPTLPGPLSRRRQSPWFGSQSIRRPAESVSQSGPYGGSVWPVGRVRRRPRHHPLGSPLLWCTAAGCGGPSGAPRSLSVRVIMSMVGSRRRRGGSVKQKLAAPGRESTADSDQPDAGRQGMSAVGCIRPGRISADRATGQRPGWRVSGSDASRRLARDGCLGRISGPSRAPPVSHRKAVPRHWAVRDLRRCKGNR